MTFKASCINKDVTTTISYLTITLCLFVVYDIILL